MEWTSLVVGLGVPILSFVTGMMANKISQRDVRTRLKHDVELLGLLPPASAGYLTLRDSIDERIRGLAEKSKPVDSWWAIAYPRDLRPRLSAGFQLMVGGLLILLLGSWIAAIGGAEFVIFSDFNRWALRIGLALLGAVMFVVGGQLVLRSIFTYYRDITTHRRRVTSQPPMPAPTED